MLIIRIVNQSRFSRSFQFENGPTFRRSFLSSPISVSLVAWSIQRFVKHNRNVVLVIAALPRLLFPFFFWFRSVTSRNRLCALLLMTAANDHRRAAGGLCLNTASARRLGAAGGVSPFRALLRQVSRALPFVYGSLTLRSLFEGFLRTEHGLKTMISSYRHLFASATMTRV